MKKLLAIALALVLCLSVFAGCSSNTAANETKPAADNTQTTAAAETTTEAAPASTMKVGFKFEGLVGQAWQA